MKMYRMIVNITNKSISINQMMNNPHNISNQAKVGIQGTQYIEIKIINLTRWYYR